MPIVAKNRGPEIADQRSVTGLSFGKAWRVRAFGTNLTDVLGVTSAGSLYRGYDDPRYRIENVMRPRTIGFGVDYKFE